SSRRRHTRFSRDWSSDVCSSDLVTFRHVMADWPEDQLPKVPAGFKVERLTSDLKNPRTSYIAANGDLFVTESNTFNSADRITILRDADKNGSYEVREVFAENLRSEERRVGKE